MLALTGPLRGHPDPTARELCLSLVSGDEPGAAGALEVIGAMRDLAAAERLVAAIPHLGRRPVRRARLYAALGDLQLAGRQDAATQALLTAATDSDAGARASAMWALGKTPMNSKLDAAVTQALRVRLTDPSGAVRMNALAALARRGKLPENEALGTLLSDSDPGVRANALRYRGAPGRTAANEVDPTGLLRNALAARERHADLPGRGNDYLFVRLVSEGNDASPSARIGLADGLAVFFLADERGFIRDEAVPSGDLVIAPGDATHAVE
jgi:HEAT repeat protein